MPCNAAFRSQSLYGLRLQRAGDLRRCQHVKVRFQQANSELDPDGSLAVWEEVRPPPSSFPCFLQPSCP